MSIVFRNFAQPKSELFGYWCIAHFYDIKFSYTKFYTYKNTGEPSFSSKNFQITTQKFSDKHSIYGLLNIRLHLKKILALLPTSDWPVVSLIPKWPPDQKSIFMTAKGLHCPPVSKGLSFILNRGQLLVPFVINWGE